MKTRMLCCITFLLSGALPALAQFDSGSDGSDGAFFPVVDIVIDLSLAATASWDTPSPNPGLGVYDPEKWAVVFKYAAITVQSGVDVTFVNHPSGAPVVWLSQGDVTIDGTVHLSGANGTSTGSSYAEPGPGGFAGGRRAGVDLPSSAGFGPGGGNGQGTYDYGNEFILPLIGGSGGTGSSSYNGGAGGGAILIASSESILVNGTVRANAGGSISSQYGSGGAVRLVANAILGTGYVSASGYSNDGRIRMEGGDFIDFEGSSNPVPSLAYTPGPLFPPSNAPKLRVTQIAGEPVPADPEARIKTIDVEISDEGAVTIHIEAMNIPVGTQVQVRVVPQRGPIIETISSPLVGSEVLSTATAIVPFPLFRSEIQLKANFSP